MIRSEYLDRVIKLYIAAPDTPVKEKPSDWVIAARFHQSRVPLDLIEHAIALATLRRNIRPTQRVSLEPIRSLAYLRPLVDQLLRTGIDDGYRRYVAARYTTLKQ